VFGKKRRKGMGAAKEAHMPMHQLELTLGMARQKRRPVVLRGKEAAQHRFILGTTGVGKSKLLVSLALQLLNQRIAFCLLDPAGDLCDDILAALYDEGFFRDARAWTRLRYLDLSRSDRYLPFNVVNQPFDSYGVAQFVLESWKRAWSALAGGGAPVIENLVLAGVFVLAENREPLTKLQLLLTDGRYRAQLLQHVSDPQILEFFSHHFDALGKRSNQLGESTLRRAFLLSFDPHLRFALGQHENSLRWRELMDNGVSALINVGGLEPEVQRFLGCLVSVGIEQAALSRADIAEEARQPYHYIVDEFSQFAARSEDALDRILALTRKYGLSLTMATQTMSQVGSKLQGALQNTTFISFRVGAEDAPYAVSRVGTLDLQRVKYSPRGTPQWMGAGEQKLELSQLVTTLPPREIYLRVGDTTQRVRTLGVPEPRCARQELKGVKEHYAALYLKARHVIEQEMAAASATPESGSTQGAPNGQLRRRARAERVTLLLDESE
jgi:hypothetical protein